MVGPDIIRAYGDIRWLEDGFVPSLEKLIQQYGPEEEADFSETQKAALVDYAQAIEGAEAFALTVRSGMHRAAWASQVAIELPRALQMLSASQVLSRWQNDVDTTSVSVISDLAAGQNGRTYFTTEGALEQASEVAYFEIEEANPALYYAAGSDEPTSVLRAQSSDFFDSLGERVPPMGDPALARIELHLHQLVAHFQTPAAAERMRTIEAVISGTARVEGTGLSFEVVFPMAAAAENIRLLMDVAAQEMGMTSEQLMQFMR